MVSPHREPLNVRFAPRATKLLRRREMSRWANERHADEFGVSRRARAPLRSRLRSVPFFTLLRVGGLWISSLRLQRETMRQLVHWSQILHPVRNLPSSLAWASYARARPSYCRRSMSSLAYSAESFASSARALRINASFSIGPPNAAFAGDVSADARRERHDVLHSTHPRTQAVYTRSHQFRWYP